MKNIKPLVILCLAIQLSACTVLPLSETDPKRSVNWCPPLPNCASTEAVSFVHKVKPFILTIPLSEAWPSIVKAVEQLPRTSIEKSYPGYIYAKTQSEKFKFVDYFEVLAVPENERLMVRSASQMGLSDMFVNAARINQFRAILLRQGVVKKD